MDPHEGVSRDLQRGDVEPAGRLLRAFAVGLLGGSAALVLRFAATEAPRLVWPGRELVQGVALAPVWEIGRAHV